MKTGSGARSGKRFVVVGGGVTGCVLAERIKQRHPDCAVTLLEGSSTLGGLSVRSEPDPIGWDRFYHVVTPQDVMLIDWLRRLGVEDRLRWRGAHTGFYADGALHRFDTPLDFLRFPPLNLVDKGRLGASILYASRISDGTPLWNITASDWLRKISGDTVYRKFWEPLLRAKLGSAHQDVAATFIWSTIRRLYATRQAEGRREAFGYISGGYAPVFTAAEHYLSRLGVTVRKSAPVEHISDGPDGSTRIRTRDGSELLADRVVYTGPSRFLPKLCQGMSVPESLLTRAHQLRYLGVLCMVVKLTRAFCPYYVLNLTDPGLPFTGVIGLTTLVDPVETGGHHLCYLPRYLPDDDADFDKPDEAFVEPFLSALERIGSRRGFRRDEILLSKVFRSRFVSPIAVLGYDKLRLPIPLVPSRLYLLNTGRILGGTLNNSQMIEEAERGLDEILA
jgi:protoporphyrinogen oxidase